MRGYELFNVDMTPGTAGRWVARVTNLPGCLSQGRSEKETFRKIKDAMRGCLHIHDTWGISEDDMRGATHIEQGVRFPAVSGADACLALFYLGWQLVATTEDHMLLIGFGEDPVLSVPFDVSLDNLFLRRLAEDGHLDVERFTAALVDRSLGLIALTESQYADYVEHPRYGKGPRITGRHEAEGFLWHSGPDCRITNTTITADPKRQKRTYSWADHYCDLKRVCLSCGRPFIFYAEEQRHWYEELQIPLAAEAVRCVECRKAARRHVRLSSRYEALLKLAQRSDEESFELVEAGLALVDDGVFGQTALEHLRAVLKKLPVGSERTAGLKILADELLGRLTSESS